MSPCIRRTRPRRRVGLAFATALALVLVASSAHAAPTWTRVASPNRGTIGSALLDVAAVPGTTTAWAVGYYYDTQAAAFRTMTQRYNGSSWSIVASPNASVNGYSQLTNVDASSPSNVWAVGYDTQAGPLVERYDGTRWIRVSSPSISLNAVDVVSSTEVWVAGYSGSSATVAQWKNGTWTTRYSLASVGRHLSVFEGITVDAAGQVWAVGWDRDYDAPGRPVSSVVVRFDGTRWVREATPNPGDRNFLNDVVTTAAGQVFAVGLAQDTSGGGIEPSSLFLRRQGATWASLEVPAEADESQGQLHSVAAVSASSVWAVGYYYAESSGLHQPLLVHWTSNGGAGVLTTHDVTPAIGGPATPWGVSATPTGRLWAVGNRSTTMGDRTLVLRGTGG
jgi:hypothetical protein